MYYDEIKTKIEDRMYENQLPYPKRTFSKNDVIDENKSVKWNREELERLEQEFKSQQTAYREENNRLANEFYCDCKSYIINNCGVDEYSATKIYNLAYTNGHSCGYLSVLGEVDELVDLIADINFVD